MPTGLSRPEYIVLVNNSSRSFEEVKMVADAIHFQVNNHLSAIWGVSCIVTARQKGDPIPTNSWLVHLTNTLSDPRLGGVHYYTPGGAPYALVAANRNDWSLSASHEVLEMLTDPKTDTFRRAMDPNGTVGLVDYLVEICDPCQHLDFAYAIPDRGNVIVSDFYGPGYFDMSIGPGRHNMRGTLTRPLQILPGGYLCFRDARGDMYMATLNGTQTVNYQHISGFQLLPGDSVREQVDFFTAAFDDLGCYGDHKKQVTRKSRKQPLGFDKFGAGPNGNARRKKMETEVDRHMAHLEEFRKKVKAYDLKLKTGAIGKMNRGA